MTTISMRHASASILLILLILIAGCTEKSVYEPVLPPDDPPEDPIEEKGYQADIPENKLPWPHHAPEISEEAYQNLLDDLFILNNYGQFQGSYQSRDEVYLHDGLDLILYNGTPIYAVQSGYIRKAVNSGVGSSYCIVEDEDNPGFGWEYAHMIPESFYTGEYVEQGTRLGTVSFAGVDHLHLSRIHLRPGKNWSHLWEWEYMCPDSFFVFPDRLSPVVERNFHYFRNESNTLLHKRSGTPVVSGDVDIVVGMREIGSYARGYIIQNSLKYTNTVYGDRLCITHIEYEISGSQIETRHRKSFDFRKIRLIKKLSAVGIFDPDQTLTVYKYYKHIHPQGPIDYNQLVQYYIITNTDGTGEAVYLDPAQRMNCWDTDATDASGNPLFPNGGYTITVHVYDSEGNCTTAVESVIVEN